MASTLRFGASISLRSVAWAKEMEAEVSRPILHELGFLVTFMGWLGLAWLAGSLAALVVAALYAGWWVVR